MKNTVKVLGIIALIAIIGFAAISMIGCSSPGDGNKPDGNEGKTTDEKTLVSIEVTTLPTKTHYNLGEDLKLDGMVVTATYSDDSTAAVTDYTTDTSGYVKTKTGHHTIIVTYKDKTAEFSVNVVDPTKPTVAKPTAAPAAGTYNEAQSVTLTTKTAGAKIYYTTDGTEPSEESALYSSAINISETTTIKAFAVFAGYNDSELLTAKYIIILPFTSAPVLTLEPENAKIKYIWTASNPVADSYDVYWKEGSGLSAADVKSSNTKQIGASSGGAITGLTNGTTYSVIVVANKAGYTSIDSVVHTATPEALLYVINGSGTTFTATKNGVAFGTADQPIQTVIDAIRGDVAGAACIIHFGDGETVLDVGTTPASFSGTWGKVELSGKITGNSTNSATSGTNATIAIANAVSVTSTADIANTGATNGRAIYHNSTGTLSISGGTVSGATGYAVTNASTGAVTISGGTVSATTGRAVSNNAGGAVTISSNSTVQATENGSAVYNTAAGPVNISGGTVKTTTGYAVYNYVGGAVSISGGIVQATETNGCAVQNNGVGEVNISGGTVSAIGNAVYNNAAGKITVSGTTTRVTSANVTNTSGTIYLRSSGTTADPRLVIEGGTVENTSTAAGNAIYNGSTGAVTISGGTVSTTGTTGGAVYNNSTGVITVSGTARVTSTVVAGSGGTIALAGSTSGTADRLIITGGTVESTSSSGYAISNSTSGAINISGGTVSATTGRAVNNSSTGKIKVSGSARITAATENNVEGTITIASSGTATDPRLEITGGTIENTSVAGNAVCNNSTGEVTMSGGMVSVTGISAIAIRNVSTGALTISGGTVSVTGTSAKAIYNDKTGAVTISGGTVSAPVNDTAYSIYNNSTGAVSVTSPPAVIVGARYPAP